MSRYFNWFSSGVQPCERVVSIKLSASIKAGVGITYAPADILGQV